MKETKTDFYDLNQFPVTEGIIYFPISMSRITNSQNAKTCFEYLEHLVKKIRKPAVGVNIIYGDFLYLNSDEKASKLKSKYLPLILSHKNSFLNILKKNPWYIRKSFSFITWNQLVLDAKDYFNYLGELKKIYAKDKDFQKAIEIDAINAGKKFDDENQINFFIEEILMFYLIAKGRVRMVNEFVVDHEKWILMCYPGKPLLSEVYIFQKNLFGLNNTKNKFENCYYDLEEKKLYDYNKIDLKYEIERLDK